jgi:hypothetical protein
MPVNPAYVMQGRADHPAQLFRMALAGVATGPAAVGVTSPKGGVSPFFGGAMQVTGLGSMNVTVNTGLAYVPHSSAWNGAYACYNAATYNVSIPGASASQYRRDYIAIAVTDPGDATASWDIVDVQGTNSSTSPGSLPTLPNNALPLGIVNVTPNMTVTSGAGTITDSRSYAPLPGPYICTSTTRPINTAPSGTIWYETDTGSMGIMVNGAPQYFVIAPSVIDTWHDMRPGNSGWGTSVTGEYPPQYKFSPDGLRVELFGAVTIKPSGTISNVAIFANAVPSPYRPAVTVRGSLVLEGVAGFTGYPQWAMHSDGTLRFEGIDGQYGETAFINGSYPANGSGLVPHL